jgi:hypothetical protein
MAVYLIGRAPKPSDAACTRVFFVEQPLFDEASMPEVFIAVGMVLWSRMVGLGLSAEDVFRLMPDDVQRAWLDTREESVIYMPDLYCPPNEAVFVDRREKRIVW